ncbi:glucosamine-6-phosphate deaminase [Alloscardovia macacae]|uniref:Glucosamine-6-phosphate deaminase n=1 Tax=Alloscardovia macacae TaxID=1160091 RepID=A0A1Y2SVI0_9BIFI|nr:glucosamine-6-phosphate deaminase [Alloscardovia macacae]OTA25971.1 glucosamine-6-phosphate deaminase [Alloscardovia macacae]OTA28738.1 glucosamine-6-phosphate deaminase [Alloscardovia macacae]
MAEVLIVKTQEEAGAIYAQAVGEAIKANPKLVLGLATGSTPHAAYQALAKKVKDEGIDVSQVRGFALDEYAGLDPEHPESYHSVIRREVVEPVGLNPELINVPNGALETLPHAGADYDAAIEAAGGVDIQILGIGTDGHIGFNEPGSSLASPTRMKTLTEQTRIDNARFFDGDLSQVPTHCITQGVGTIMKARHLILLAFGEGKADAVAASVEGPVTSICPASALQMHPHATFIVDEAAASKLQYAQYYAWVAQNKPEWQKL